MLPYPACGPQPRAAVYYHLDSVLNGTEIMAILVPVSHTHSCVYGYYLVSRVESLKTEGKVCENIGFCMQIKHIKQ